MRRLFCWMKGILVVAVLGGFLPSSQKGIASEFVVYGMYRGLNLGPPEEAPQKDYYINMGLVHGLREGTILQVMRRVATYDISNERLYRDVVFPIALVKIIHAEPMASIAREYKILPSDKTPVATPRTIMVGDLVKISNDS